MQETPEFPTLQQRSTGYSYEQFISDPKYPITEEASIKLLRDVFNDTPLYFSASDYRQTLNNQRRLNVETHIRSIYDQFDSIIASRINDTFPSTVQNAVTNIGSYFDEFTTRFTEPRRIFLLEGGTDIQQNVENIRENLSASNGYLEDLKKRIQEANITIGRAADESFANFFHQLYNGRTFKQQEENDSNNAGMNLSQNDKKNLSTRRANRLSENYYLIIISVLISALFLPGKVETHHIHTWFTSHWLQVGTIGLLGLIVGGINIYKTLMNWLSKNAAGGYERSASIWMIWTIVAVVLAAVYSIILAFTLKGVKNQDVVIIAAKVLTLLVPAYFIRFAVRNYSVNKHQAVLNKHRAVVAAILVDFASPLDNPGSEVKKGIYDNASRLIFDPGESGFITRKEGAGSSNTIFDGLNLPR